LDIKISKIFACGAEKRELSPIGLLNFLKFSPSALIRKKSGFLTFQNCQNFAKKILLKIFNTTGEHEE